jgi:hypothetical protein
MNATNKEIHHVMKHIYIIYLLINLIYLRKDLKYVVHM